MGENMIEHQSYSSPLFVDEPYRFSSANTSFNGAPLSKCHTWYGKTFPMQSFVDVSIFIPYIK